MHRIPPTDPNSTTNRRTLLFRSGSSIISIRLDRTPRYFAPQSVVPSPIPALAASNDDVVDEGREEGEEEEAAEGGDGYFGGG
jgi:hypothetical protein